VVQCDAVGGGGDEERVAEAGCVESEVVEMRYRGSETGGPRSESDMICVCPETDVSILRRCVLV